MRHGAKKWTGICFSSTSKISTTDKSIESMRCPKMSEKKVMKLNWTDIFIQQSCCRFEFIWFLCGFWDILKPTIQIFAIFIQLTYSSVWIQFKKKTHVINWKQKKEKNKFRIWNLYPVWYQKRQWIKDTLSVHTSRNFRE